MSKEFKFFICLMEYYAEYKNTDPGEVLRILTEKDLVGLVIGSYELYHIERLENAFMDLDSLIATGKVAY